MNFFISLLLLFSLSSAAQIDEFALEANYMRDYDSALKVAKEQNKPIMMLVVTAYCPWCKKFERKTLSSTMIRELVKKDFIALVIDKRADEGKYPKEFKSPLVPTVYFIDPSTQKPLYESLGYMKKKPFSKEMNIALNIYKKKKQ